VYFIIPFISGELTNYITFGASEIQAYSCKECPKIRIIEKIYIYFVQTSMVELGSSLSTYFTSLTIQLYKTKNLVKGWSRIKEEMDESLAMTCARHRYLPPTQPSEGE
jgi:hypothetical protein